MLHRRWSLINRAWPDILSLICVKVEAGEVGVEVKDSQTPEANAAWEGALEFIAYEMLISPVYSGGSQYG